MSKSFYITTTLPYVNAEPHIGFAMEIVRADSIARYRRLLGDEVFFNTGTDEHGAKLLTDANKAGKDVQSYVNSYAERFRELAPLLNLSVDNFIRTTDKNHVLAAQEFWRRVDKNGYIYKKKYQTKYCVGCELEKTDSELVNGKCPLHPDREIELIDEENYFFKLSAFGDKLLKYYEENKNFVVPDFRFNETKSFIKQGLEDFSISRLKSKMSWGVPVPNDDMHVMYVWFDALVNYISALGWPDNKEKFEKFWKNGTPVQYCGKDNNRQQAIMWQAMLMAADLPLTNKVIVNGFITGEGGVKMSKSLGNVVSPVDLVKKYGTDAVRCFVLKELSSFEDSPFTIERFNVTYNTNLANGLGNLVSRIMKMAESYNIRLETYTKSEIGDYEKGMNNFDLKGAMDSIWSGVMYVDGYIQKNEPFKKIKTNPEEAKKDIQNVLGWLKEIGEHLAPLLPETSKNIISLIESNKAPVKPLFPRIEL